MRKKWLPAQKMIGDICVCAICHAYRVGSTTDELAEAYRLADARPILDLLAEHGTPIRTGPWQSRRRPSGAPMLAVLLLLAASLALPSPVAAKGRPSIPGLKTETRAEVMAAARHTRAADAERAYSSDPLSRLVGGTLLRVSNFPTVATTDNRLWNFYVWTKPGQHIGIVVLEECDR